LNDEISCHAPTNTNFGDNVNVGKISDLLAIFSKSWKKKETNDGQIGL